MLSDEWLPRYRLLENFTIKWNGNGNAHGNGNAYDRGDYNSSFALRAVDLIMRDIGSDHGKFDLCQSHFTELDALYENYKTCFMRYVYRVCFFLGGGGGGARLFHHAA